MRLRNPLLQSFELGDGISAVPSLPDSILESASDFPRLPLWLVTTRQADDWDRRVRNDLELALKAMLLAVPFSCPSFVFLSWGEDSKLARKEQIIQRYLYTAGSGGIRDDTAGNGGIRVGMSELRQAREALGGLGVVFSSRSFMRIRRGLQAFFHGLQEELTGDRLHQFVRSLEAVINPKIGNTTRQFVQRLQVFTESGPDVDRALKECYEIRCKVEHLQNPASVLQHVPSQRRNAYIYLHTRRIETLCRHVYGRIASSPKHLALFEDDTINEFWSRNEKEQRSLWGEPLRSFAGTPWKKETDEGQHSEQTGMGKATGVVKWFNAEKGYGFIAPDSGHRDLFVHYTWIEGTGYRALSEGQKVEFEAVPGQKGPHATRVRTIGAQQGG